MLLVRHVKDKFQGSKKRWCAVSTLIDAGGSMAMSRSCEDSLSCVACLDVQKTLLCKP